MPINPRHSRAGGNQEDDGTQARSPECICVASVLGHTLRRGVRVEPRKVHGHGLILQKAGEKAMQGVKRVETHRVVLSVTANLGHILSD